MSQTKLIDTINIVRKKIFKLNNCGVDCKGAVYVVAIKKAEKVRFIYCYQGFIEVSKFYTYFLTTLKNKFNH